MACKICAHNLKSFDQGQVLGKYAVQYFQCEYCGLIQPENPYWLNEAYANAITRSDLGLISRNIKLSTVTKAIILAFFDSSAHFLDYGAGYGVLVRLMRDNGLDFYWNDKYCENIFAKGFEVAQYNRSDKFELLTAFEVFEHLADPLDEIRQMLSFSESVLFTTTVVPEPAPPLEAWWYYGLEHGQHVSLYTRHTLEYIAQEFNLNLYTNGHVIYLLTPKKINSLIFRLVSRKKTAFILNLLLKTRLKEQSLRSSDYFNLTQKEIHLR